MTERPNDPAAELSDAPIRAKNAHRDVAAFIAARAAAQLTPERADDVGINGHADPTPPRDPPPGPEPVAPEPPLPPRPEARPRIVEDPVILGLTRVSRSRLGSRLFTWFFVFIYALILIQLIVSLLQT